jgi:hypothetical protein
MATCFYHTDTEASTNCAQCGLPICNACTELVANKSVCHGCVDTITARIQAQLDRNPPAQTNPAPGYSANAPGNVQAPYRQPYTAPPPSYAVQQQAQPGQGSIGRLILGLAAGLVAGLVAAVIWEKITFYSGFNIGYLTALLGFCVGFAIVFVGKQGGPAAGIGGGVIALLVQLFGYYLLACDYASKAAGTAMILDPSFVMQHINDIIDPFGWVIMAFGVWGGYRTPMRASGHMN